MPALKLDPEVILCFFVRKMPGDYCLLSSDVARIGFQTCTLKPPPPRRFANGNLTLAVFL